ncbi:hypothetical protein FB562_1832 [Homoserinimonas aerilata]|uniref:Uncharacterized protein n=1 Tax=Homoserinimonas aerilata TaxID=1162970 RepID=A0A542YKX1_9MICO|nr:hypothetical protein [Homoserinimonas aerilata]TQL48733.1 hypothetical protein FB562_1832 [Homoserinimonas aerilata]
MSKIVRGATHELVFAAIAAENPDAAKRAESVIDSVLEVAHQQAIAAGLDAQQVVTSVSITHGERPAVSSARTAGKGWPFPFSGKICIWFCPDGGPYDAETCYLICIEWWFPVAARV